MNIQEFINKMEVEIDGIQPGTLQPDTNFRALAEWSSMHSLILIAFIDVEYDVTISGEDLLNSKTIDDLFNLVKNRHS